ncbi:MAG: hypothetical protein ABH818_00810 [Patescibacteria group bacterium]
MDKIPIKKIFKNVYQQKGFPSGPFDVCLICRCGETKKGGACCEKGVYVDKESYDLIIKHKKKLEEKIGIKIKECFDEQWSEDTEYLGKKGIGTKVKNGTCVFRVHPKQGCEIVSFVLKNNLPKRMIPSACRLYPITWDNGELFLEKIKKNCVCINKNNKTKRLIYESQKEEIDDIFSFE